jgi:hypothetical protein
MRGTLPASFGQELPCDRALPDGVLRTEEYMKPASLTSMEQRSRLIAISDPEHSRRAAAGNPYDPVIEIINKRGEARSVLRELLETAASSLDVAYATLLQKA